MSFSKTVSVVAALGSIFSVGLASWKLADMNSQQPPSVLDQRIEQLEKQLAEAQQQPVESAPPAPFKLPPVTPQQVPEPTTLPPAPTPPTPPPPVTETTP